MTEKERQQFIGLPILKPDDTTSWKLALKSELGRRAAKREIFRRRARPGLLRGILNRLKRTR
jgi:hypothetical protein